MNKRNMGQVLVLTVLAAMLIPAMGVQAQEEQQTKLGDVISEYGFNWLIGRWEASMDDGQKITIQYRWALDKNLVLVNFQMGEYAMQGMIFFKPLDEEVVQIGADNRGGHSKATWAPDGDKAVAKYEFTTATGEVRKIALTHAMVDKKTFTSEMFAIEDDGTLADTPWGTLEYKRVRRGPGKKAKDAAATPAKSKNDLVGKWNGEFENEWQEKNEFAVVITKNDKGGYQIKIQESFEDWAETFAVLNAKQDESGAYKFEGDSDAWSGSGSGTVEKKEFKGTYKGTESGKFTMRRVPKP
jgi:hypothetical protein